MESPTQTGVSKKEKPGTPGSRVELVFVPKGLPRPGHFRPEACALGLEGKRALLQDTWTEMGEERVPGAGLLLEEKGRRAGAMKRPSRRQSQLLYSGGTPRVIL